MRTKAFWEETREAALARGNDLHLALLRVELEIRRFKQKVKVLQKKSGKAEMRALYRRRIETLEAELSRIQKESAKAVRKALYCTERLMAEPKNRFDRIRENTTHRL